MGPCLRSTERGRTVRTHGVGWEPRAGCQQRAGAEAGRSGFAVFHTSTKCTLNLALIPSFNPSPNPK